MVVRRGCEEQRGKGLGASREGATREVPATQERRWSRRFMLGREWGRESALLWDLRWWGWPEVRYGEGLGAAEEDTTA
jgi:hypothetical protein